MSKLLRTKSVDEILNDPHAREGGGGLKKVLKAKDLISLGVGAIIGAGIFATTGQAAAGTASHPGAGPAVTICYVLVAIACGFSALCYAEFASFIPIAGSAYTYSYATLGELAAWIIGWDLILEYAVGNSVVAISWSGYFDSVLRFFNIHIPKWLLTPSYQTKIDPEIMEQLQRTAPHIGDHLFYFNLPAAIIVLLITALLVRGVKESTSFNNVVVVLKLLVLAIFVIVGANYVAPSNWHPFAPNGWAGIKAAAAGIFFAYIGFDAVSTASEETENPGRNLPIGMLGSLAICTALYILVSAVMTGMVHYSVLGTSDPMATAFEVLGKEPGRSALDMAVIQKCQIIVAVGAVLSMTAVLLVFQMGQPRIFFSMARDGLLPPVFSQVHPKYQTPHVTTIATGVIVAISSAILDQDLVLDLCNVGTLSAFAVVCASVLLLRYRDGHEHPQNGTPYKGSALATLLLAVVLVPLGVKQSGDPAMMAALLVSAALAAVAGYKYLNLPGCTPRPFNTPFVPLFPVLGVLTCFILLSGSPVLTWVRFAVWLAMGLVIYAMYGSKHSRLNPPSLD